MISRYGIFCKVIEQRSFTKAAYILGYSQSSVSQSVKALEDELNAVLIDRKRDGIVLTSDGKELFPYIYAIYAAENGLDQKKKEIEGLENSTVTIGTFTGVSRTVLPLLMKEFKEIYPKVSFNLRQGEYTSIGRWIAEGSVDFGFVNTEAVPDLEGEILYEEEMLAVLPPDHPLAKNDYISLKEISQEPIILLDEGEYSVPLLAFQRAAVVPKIAYKVYDDYTILSMVSQKLGVSLLYDRVLDGVRYDVAIRRVLEKPKRTVALAWKDYRIMPFAARKFADNIIKKTQRKDFA